jgi:hypothetical protein
MLDDIILESPDAAFWRRRPSHHTYFLGQA